MSFDKYILYVDDDPDDSDLLTDAIGGYQNQIKVICIDSGESAINFLTNAQGANRLPQLIILDINMPRINGQMLFSKIKSLLPENSIPYLFFTTSPKNDDIIQEESKGITILKKPNTTSGYQSVAFTILDMFFPDIAL
jgi:CheY-like chemotaxis protein